MTSVNPGKHGIFDFFKYKIVSENELVTELALAYDPSIREYTKWLLS